MTDQNINTTTLIKKYFTTEYITIITFLIYSCGILYNYFYFKIFGINIIKYLSLQETFVDTSIYIAVLILLSLIFVPASFYLAFGIFIFKKNNRIRRYVSVSRKIKNMYYLNFIKNYWIYTDLFLAVFVILILIFVYILLKINFITSYFQFYIPLLGISTMIKTSIVSQFNNSNIVKCVKYFLFGIISLIVIYLMAFLNLNIILGKKSIKKEIITLSSGVKYSTNDSIYNIGETSSTIFLYNRSLNNTIILNKSNVLQIELINQATLND